MKNQLEMLLEIIIKYYNHTSMALTRNNTLLHGRMKFKNTGGRKGIHKLSKFGGGPKNSL